MHRAGFTFNGNIEHGISRQRQRRVGLAGHRQQHHGFLFQARNDVVQLFGAAGVGDKQHDVAAFYHSQIAVKRFCWMNKECRSTGAGEGGSEFFADMTGFTHPGNNQFAFAVQDGVGGLNKGLVKTVG